MQNLSKVITPWDHDTNLLHWHKQIDVFAPTSIEHRVSIPTLPAIDKKVYRACQMRLVDRVGVCPSRLTLKVCLSCGEVDSSFLPLARLVGRMRAAVTALGLCTRRLIQSGNLWSGGSFASSSAAKNILYFFTLAILKRRVSFTYTWLIRRRILSAF